jgi:hypothetical protein
MVVPQPAVVAFVQLDDLPVEGLDQLMQRRDPEVVRRP